MSEKHLSFGENELSEDDLAVLRAFEAMDDAQMQSSLPVSTPPSDRKQQASTEFSFEDMLLVFVSEVDEDITALHRALHQLEHETSIQPGRFEVFRRHGHKIHGSAGFVEYHSIVKVAQHIEDIAIHALNSALSPETSVKALQYTIVALETLFQQVIATGKEDDAPLIQLEGELSSLSIHKEVGDKSTELMPVDGEDFPLLSNISSSAVSTTSYMRVDASRFEDLLRHSEQLGELSTPLASALEQVEKALQELSSAQSRMAKLESMHFALLTASQSSPFIEELPTSSLMARILSKAGQGNDSSHVSYKDKSKTHVHTFKSSSSSVWDELDIERYSEQDLLLNSIREVISEVNIASTHVRIAFAHLHVMLQEYTNQANIVHSDTLILRLVPLSILIPRLQEALAANNSDQGQHIEFEVVGDETEIDQQILAALSVPLIQLLATCRVDTSSDHKEEPARVWLHAQETGNTITIEVGFSVTASGGAVDPLRETVQRLDGTLSLQRNTSGGASFHLRLPRSQSTIRCLLIRVNDQQVIVPFSQVQRIGDSKREKFDTLYSLHDLLACPTKLEVSNRIQPVLVLLQRTSPYSVGVIVDEVMDEVELVVKPLASYLQRPGITNAGIDGKGRVLLMADLPELVRHYTQLRYNANNKNPVKTEAISPIRQTPPKILLADDSVALRNTLVHMLKHANYGVLEARDGLEALEQLVQHVPDVFLLDVEMPNLNGYDLLGIMHLYPSLASVKIIMLTSRSSEKHIQHAMDLGAHAYLTKPCSQETLMETIQKMLQS
ncbi:MAG: response regulator [Ktedonobacteraceae bacterium]|nr:response regulator [Ktedonobacteraceae bacterium]